MAYPMEDQRFSGQPQGQQGQGQPAMPQQQMQQMMQQQPQQLLQPPPPMGMPPASQQQQQQQQQARSPPHDDFPQLGDFPHLGGAMGRSPPQHAMMAGNMMGFGGMTGYGGKKSPKMREEFSITSEMFPALPGAKAGGSTDEEGGAEPPGVGPRSSPKEGQPRAEPGPDRCGGFGLLGLLRIIQLPDPDLKMLALGTDLTTLGLNLGTPDHLFPTFQSPWQDGPLKPSEPAFTLPQCYEVMAATLGSATARLGSVKDETLFYVFYGMPGDVSQLAAAGTLYERNWRYHKELKIWITRAPNVEPSQKTAAYERGTYIYFDTTQWKKLTKEFTLQYDQLEERNAPAPQQAAA